MILSILLGFITGLPTQIGKPELIQTPPQWRCQGVENVTILNRDADDGEVEISSETGPLLDIKAEGIFFACKGSATPEICKQNLAPLTSATFIRIDSKRTALFLFSNDHRPDPGRFGWF